MWVCSFTTMKCLYGNKGRVALVEFYAYLQKPRNIQPFRLSSLPSHFFRGTSFILTLYGPSSPKPMDIGQLRAPGSHFEPILNFQSILNFLLVIKQKQQIDQK